MVHPRVPPNANCEYLISPERQFEKQLNLRFLRGWVGGRACGAARRREEELTTAILEELSGHLRQIPIIFDKLALFRGERQLLLIIGYGPSKSGIN